LNQNGESQTWGGGGGELALRGPDPRGNRMSQSVPEEKTRRPRDNGDAIRRKKNSPPTGLKTFRLRPGGEIPER